MEIKDNKFKITSIILFLVIIAIVVFVIIPKYSTAAPEQIVEKIDFSNSSWIEKYMEDNIGLIGKDFYINTAFSYNLRSNKMVVTYASQITVEEAREYYLSLPEAEQTGRNDETSLNIAAEKNGQTIKIYNYFSSISRVLELELTLAPENADNIISQLEEEFPTQELSKIQELKDIISGDIFGGYVRYRYDSFDDFDYPYIPIYSRAYLSGGTEEDISKIINDLNEKYPSFKYNESQDTYYYKINGQILSISYFVTDSGEEVVSISIQKNESLDS